MRNWLIILWLLLLVGVGNGQVTRYNVQRPMTVDTLVVRDSLTVLGDLDVLGSISGVTLLTATTLKGDSLNVGPGDFIVAPTQNTIVMPNVSVIGMGTSDLETWTGTTSVFESLDTSIGFGTDTDIQVTSNAYDPASWKYKTADFAANYYMYKGEHIWRVASSQAANSSVSWTEAMRVNNSGQLGLQVTSFDHDLEIGSGTYSEIDAGEATFTTSSHSSYKENFVAPDIEAIQQAFSGLRVLRYNFKESFVTNNELIQKASQDTLLPPPAKYIVPDSIAQKMTTTEEAVYRARMDSLLIGVWESKVNGAKKAIDNEKIRAKRISQKQYVSLMADDFFPVSQALAPSESDSTKLNMNHVIASMIIMIQQQQIQIDSLKALHK